VSRLGDVTLHLGIFDGPLDLLLHLIERHELDITAVSLAQVADTYLTHVRSLQSIDAYGLAEFIAVAAKLLLIKSTALLPRPERDDNPDELDDPTDLTERLREYQLFRRAASALQEREERGLRSYGRLVSLAPPVPRPRHDAGSPDHLLLALRRLADEIARRPKEEVVEREIFSIGEKIERIRESCRAGTSVSLLGLLTGVGRAEAVAVFLALLELLRLGEISAVQETLFGDVVIVGAGASTSAAIS
jgi:segregation and condensation protein A